MIRKLFNLYKGEGENAFFFAFLAFLFSFGSICGVTLSEGLFIEYVGAMHLPKAYFITALVMILSSIILLRACNTTNASRIFLYLIIAGTIFYGYASIHLVIINETTSLFWYLLKIFGYVFYYLMVCCFWIFIDQYHDLQDAKRLYTLFNTAIIAGCAAGCALISIGLNSLQIKGVLFVIFLTLAISIIWTKKLITIINPVHDDTCDENGIHYTTTKSLIKSIITSKFTLYLMIAELMIHMLGILTEFQYFSSFESFFSNTATNELTLFLGKCTAWVYTGNIIFGLFIYSRIIKKFNVRNAAPITPMLFLPFYAIWIFKSSLTLAVIGLIFVEGLSYAFHDNNFNLLMNGVPQKIKNKVRIIIESFLEPLGMLLGAFTIFFMQNSNKFSALFISAIGLILLLIVRSKYPKAIFQAIWENTIHLKTTRNYLNSINKKERLTTEYRLLTSYENSSESKKLLILELLLAFDNEKTLPLILTNLQKLNLNGKTKALKLIKNSSFSKHKQVINQLNKWLENCEKTLQGHIYLYLAKQNALPISLAREIETKDNMSQAASLIALSNAGEEKKNLVNNKIKALLESKNEEKICIGLMAIKEKKEPADIEIITPFLENHSNKIIKHAVKAIANIISPNNNNKILLKILRKHNDNNIRKACIKALKNINCENIISEILLTSMHFRPNEKRLIESIIAQKKSKKLIKKLFKFTVNTKNPDKCRLLAGRILGDINPNILRKHIRKIISHEIDRAYFYFYHYHTVQNKYPNYDLNILKNTLLTRFKNILDFIIQLLGEAGSIEKSEILSHALNSKNPKIHSYAIETLEKMCDSKIFKLISPLIEDIPKEEKLNAYIKRKLPKYTLTRISHNLG